MKTDARTGMPEELWSAAACCRFGKASLLAVERSIRRASSPAESGSKLPQSGASPIGSTA